MRALILAAAILAADSPPPSTDSGLHGFRIRSGFPRLLNPGPGRPAGLRMGAAGAILGLSLIAGFLALRGGSASIAQSSTRLAFACLFAPGVIAIGWLDVTELLAIPLLVSGSLGYCRLIKPPSWTSVAGALCSVAVVGMQLWVLLGAPVSIMRAGNLLYALPLVFLLMSAARLIPSGSGLTPARGLAIYIVAVLLPDLPRVVTSIHYPAPVDWLVAGVAFVGMFAVGISFWSIDRRLRTFPVPSA